MVLALFIVMVCTSTAAFAQKGGSGGGGTSGGGSSGGGSGGGGAVLTTVPITMDNHSKTFNTKLPKGTVTFVYSKDLLTKSLTLAISNIDVPDGTAVKLQAEEALRVTGRCWHYDYTYYTIKIVGGKGSLSLSTANGDVVPFLDPKKGWTEISIIPDSTLGGHILDGRLLFKGIL